MMQGTHDESPSSARISDGHVEAMPQNTLQNTLQNINHEAAGPPFDESAISEINSTASQRTRVFDGPSFVDNEFSDIKVFIDEEPNKHSDTRIHGPDASRLGSDLHGGAQAKGLTRSASDASDISKLSFFSIELVSDRGNAAHMNWEQSWLKQHNGHPPYGHSTSHGAPSSGASGQDENQVEPAATESVDDVIDVEFVRNKICSALVKSAFSTRNYLPLDQLCEILSPCVVRQLLLKHFDKTRALEYGREIIGTQDGDDPLPARRRRIFAILVMIYQVDRISRFIKENVDDTALPLEFDRIQGPGQQLNRVSYKFQREDEPYQRETYPRQHDNRQDEPVTIDFDVWPCHTAQDFMMWQPIIHVPFFQFPGDRIYFYDLRQDSILPFENYDQQESGGYGSVRKATIHSSHHNREGKSKSQQSHCFAIKKPHIPCLSDYLQEIDPFDKLGIEDKGNDPNHLIQLQLTFKHGRYYYLVFPWADGNLKKFWSQRTANPKDLAEVRWFMTQCSGITRGLRKLHHLSTQLSQKAGNVNAVNGTEMILGGKEWGRHGDIKPENILWFKSYNREQNYLVISDFGLTQFNSANSRSKVHQDQILGFSGTYRPPDLHLENQPISQNYDVWSLGCVFLEFLSWFLLGYKEAVDVFAQARVDDSLNGDVREDTFFAFENGLNGGPRKATLKKSVVEWIEKLHKTPQCTEPLHSLLDLIQFTMLVPNPHERWKCGWVDTKLRHLKSGCLKSDDFAIKATSRGPDRNRYPEPPEKPRIDDESPQTTPEERADINLCQGNAEDVVPRTSGSQSTRIKATAQNPVSAGGEDSTEKDLDNEIQVSDPNGDPTEDLEPQLSRISPSASTRTVRKSEHPDITLSLPGPTQESTKPQVASSGSQFDHIPRRPGRNDAAQDSSDDLTGGYGPSEETTNNAEIVTKNTMDETERGALSGNCAPKDATTNDAKAQNTTENLSGLQSDNIVQSSHAPNLDAAPEPSIPTEPKGVDQHFRTNTARPVTLQPPRWERVKKRLQSWWGMVLCRSRAV